MTIHDARELDLSRREADVTVRLTAPREPALLVKRLGAMTSDLYASADSLERCGAPPNAAGLSAHDWVGFDAPPLRLPQLVWLRRQVPSAR